MPSTSSINRYNTYSVYSSYPSYRSSSSYLNRTTSLDRSSYTNGSGSGTYYPSSKYSNGTSKNLTGLPPRSSYSGYSDSYRNGRSVRTSPSRSSYSSRISSDSADRESRYSLNRPRDYSSNRDSGYSSTYTPRDRSIDYSFTNGDTRRRSNSSLYRRDSIDEFDEDEKMKVSERIKAFESRKDPEIERLEQRRRRLGLSPTKDINSRFVRPRRVSVLDDNRRCIEENGNDTTDDSRSSVSDLCRKYSINMNLTNGDNHVQEGCSGGSTASVASYNPTIGASSSLNDIKSLSRNSSLKDNDLGYESSKMSNHNTRQNSPTSSESSLSNKANTIRKTNIASTYPSTSTISERREKLRERIALRLSKELVEDGDTPPSRRRSPTGSSSESFSDSNGLVGLRNIGNTCFMNSVLQCLSNTRCLLEYMLREYYVSDINTTLSTMKGDLIKAFGSLLSDVWRESANGPVNTCSFKAQVQRFAPTFIGYAQHDAQEFLRKLLEGLHEDVNRVTLRPKPIHDDIDETLDDTQKAMEAWKRYLRYDDSKIVDMFVGQLKSCLQCSVCGHRSITFDPFWDLSLPIPSRSGQVKMAQCLELFTKEEVLDGDERPTCAKCKERTRMTKTFSIHKFPKVLVLHLKRFSPHERWRGKLTCMVEFPLDNLDLSRFASCQSASSQYRLFGVANHSGTALSGHYTAYCRHPYLKTWHEYNDSRVSPISPNRLCSAEAYVLFYELNSY